MKIFLVILFLVASCTGTEEEAMIEMMEEEGIIAPVDPEMMEEEGIIAPVDPEEMEEEVVEPMEPEIFEPAPQPPALIPSDLPETPTVDQIDIRNQINEVVRDFPPAVLMMEDPPFTVPGGEYYDIQLYCVELYRIDTGTNCFEPVLYINDSETSDTRVPRTNSYIDEDTERSRLYVPPYYEKNTELFRTEPEEVHFFIADQRSAPDECYPYRYTFSIEETTAREGC